MGKTYSQVRSFEGNRRPKLNPEENRIKHRRPVYALAVDEEDGDGFAIDYSDRDPDWEREPRE